MSSSGGSFSILEDNPERNKQLFISVLCLPPVFKSPTSIYSKGLHTLMSRDEKLFLR